MPKNVSPFFAAHPGDDNGGPGTGYEDALTEAALFQARFGAGDGSPFRDATGGAWYAVPPYTISNRRNTRLEYITPIDRFLAPDIDRAALLSDSCMSVIHHALNIIEDVF